MRQNVFPLYLALIFPIVVVAEMVVVNVGMRVYSHEVKEATSGVMVAGVPVDLLYYVPVFSSLVITFYKYRGFQIDRTPLVPIPRQKWLRGVGLTIIAVFLFELMIEPMVGNKGFPSLSYLYRDISLVMILIWILIIVMEAVIVEWFSIHWPIWQRFTILLVRENIVRARSADRSRSPWDCRTALSTAGAADQKETGSSSSTRTRKRRGGSEAADFWGCLPRASPGCGRMTAAPQRWPTTCWRAEIGARRGNSGPTPTS